MPKRSRPLPSASSVVASPAEADEYTFFGPAGLTHVHVSATDKEGEWEVLVVDEAQWLAAQGTTGLSGVRRTERELASLSSELQLRAARYTHPLPHPPLRPALLSLDAAKHALQAGEIQAYLAALASHPEAAGSEAFRRFVGGAHPCAADAPAPPPRRKEKDAWTLVRAAAAPGGSLAEAAEEGAGGAPPPPTPTTKVTLSWTDGEGADRSLELPVLQPAHGLGHPVIDVRSLGVAGGLFTHDPGFTSTSACVSAITFIDGEKGELLHRGYPIEELASRCSFLETAFLLIEGELPSAAQLAQFESSVRDHVMVHEKLITFFGGFKSDAHPMAIMVGVVGALSAFYPEAMDITSAAGRRLSAIRLIAKMPTIAAISYKTALGQPAIYPRHSLGFAANFLHMMFATPCADYEVDATHVRALETIFVLHADHEQNASTSTVRIASSSQANPFACIAAGIASLWGPAHGGANEAVLRMLDEIGTPERIPLYLARAKDKSDPFRLMGFGHRVYKNYDPRATLMRQVCADVLGEMTRLTPELALARELEKAALADEYFVKRKLYPNVDFYSGIVLRALGIPRNMFTVLFAVARTAGWLAQWNESFADAQQRISRPRQLYVGKGRRALLPLAERG